MVSTAVFPTMNTSYTSFNYGRNTGELSNFWKESCPFLRLSADFGSLKSSFSAKNVS